MRKLFNDEAGFLISAELVLIFTVVFCGVAVGIVMVRDALVQELGDVSEAIGALNQSYAYRGISADANPLGGTLHAECSGSGFADEVDDCDCKGVSFPLVCAGIKEDPSDLDTPEGT